MDLKIFSILLNCIRASYPRYLLSWTWWLSFEPICNGTTKVDKQIAIMQMMKLWKCLNIYFILCNNFIVGICSKWHSYASKKSENYTNRSFNFLWNEWDYSDEKKKCEANTQGSKCANCTHGYSSIFQIIHWMNEWMKYGLYHIINWIFSCALNKDVIFHIIWICTSIKCTPPDFVFRIFLHVLFTLHK